MAMKDAHLRHDVEDELEWEPSLKATEIGVAVHDGIVTLTGTVPSYTEKRKAERVAKRVRGIKAVANDIEVQMPSPFQRTDAEIARVAFYALKWAIMVPDDRIKISVSNGWVYVEG